MPSVNAKPQPPRKPTKKKSTKKFSKPFVAQTNLAAKAIDWRQSNDVARRFDLTMELLCALDCHNVHEDSDPEEDTAEAMSVFIATAAYIMSSLGVSEKEACSSFRRMFKLMRSTEKRIGPRATCRDVFTEVALAVTEDED